VANLRRFQGPIARESIGAHRRAASVNHAAEKRAEGPLEGHPLQNGQSRA
jgi:hypothetical protein